MSGAPAMTHGWLETYRGVVSRWEVDHNDHLTVACYFARLDAASQRLLGTLGLGPEDAARSGHGCVTADCFVRYRRELRVGDLHHVVTGVLTVEDDGLVLVHRLHDSADGALCTTVEQRLRRVALENHAPAPLPPAARAAAETHRVTWEGPARERRPPPHALEAFAPSARDVVRPAEIGVLGTMGLAGYIHRFSAANGHAIARFGMTPAYQRDMRRGFSTFEFQCAFAGPLRAGTPITVRSALAHVGTSSLRVVHVMTDDRTGARAATLEQFGVHLDMDTRRPAPLPDTLRERAKALLAPTAP